MISPTASFTLGVDVEASPDVVWDLLVRLHEWPRWGPTVREARLDDGSPLLHAGASGRVRTVAGPWVPFRVQEWRVDEEVRHWSWRVAGIPATGHTVTARGAGCRVEMSAPWWAAGYSPVLWLGLRRVRALAEARPAGDDTTG
ncbi:SRPBCC family protein [Knoellia sp. LjRoot47]|uniref:SRPBCC family protein n=1 Tax=Knoellia sp. LjRoot47 TaxID=3342330 RepID=UPI003ECED372